MFVAGKVAELENDLTVGREQKLFKRRHSKRSTQIASLIGGEWARSLRVDVRQMPNAKEKGQHI